MEALLLLYLISLAPFVPIGLHRLDLLVRYLRQRRREVRPPRRFDELPAVTVQLPLFNERYVAARLVRSIAALDYPRDRLEIQVLDDSIDDTPEIVARCLHRLPSDVRITHIRRRRRLGFKAGALAHGLRRSRGDFVAIFDADFMPRPDFLRAVIDHFTDPGVGMVQCRWGFLNDASSILTGAQSVLLNAHFGIEHVARSRSGSFFNFNGTAGVWRRIAIDDAGGWSADTLTEDLDLSYRAQLRGWRFVYRPDVVVPSELPVDIRAFKTQQYRWSKGMAQVARKLLPVIWRSPIPLRRKLDATLHLTVNGGYPFVCLMSVVLIPCFYGYGEMLSASGPWRVLSGIFFVTNFLAIAGFLVAAELSERGFRRATLPRLAVILPVGIASAAIGARGFLAGLAGKRSPFERTPKLGLVGRGRPDLARSPSPDNYRQRPGAELAAEVLLAVYHVVWFAIIVAAGRHDLMLFSGLFMPGYLYFLYLEVRSERSGADQWAGGRSRTAGGRGRNIPMGVNVHE